MARKTYNRRNDHTPQVSGEDKAAARLAEMLVKRMEDMKLDWTKPWVTSRGAVTPRSFSGRAYNGINSFMLMLLQEENQYKLPLYVTFNKARELDAPVKRGEAGFPVCYWSFYAVLNKEEQGEDAGLKNRISELEWKKLDKEDQEKYRTIPFMTYSTVFNLDQTSYPEKYPEKYQELQDKLTGAKGLKDTEGMFKSVELDYMLDNNTWVCPVEVKQSDEAFYSPATDRITVPLKAQFESGEEFYGTLLHEMAHSTGYKDRLNRLQEGGMMTDNYAREELVAEMSAAILAAELGFGKAVEDNNVAYLQHWVQRLKQEPKFIFTLLSDINKACALIQQKVMSDEMKLNVKQQALDSISTFLEEESKNGQEKKIPVYTREQMKELTGSLNGLVTEDEWLDPQLYEIHQKLMQNEKLQNVITLIREPGGYVALGEQAEKAAKTLKLHMDKVRIPDGGLLNRIEFASDMLNVMLPQLVRKGHRVAIVDETSELLNRKEVAQPQERKLHFAHLGNGIAVWQEGDEEYTCHISPERKVSFYGDNEKNYSPANLDKIKKMAEYGNMFASQDKYYVALNPVNVPTKYMTNDVTHEVYFLHDEKVGDERVATNGRIVIRSQDIDKLPDIEMPDNYIMEMEGIENIEKGYQKGMHVYFHTSLHDREVFLETLQTAKDTLPEEELKEMRLFFHVKDGNIVDFRRSLDDLPEECRNLPKYTLNGTELKASHRWVITEDMPVSLRVLADKLCVIRLDNSDCFQEQCEDLRKMGVIFDSKGKTQSQVDRRSTEYEGQLDDRNRGNKDKSMYLIVRNGIAERATALLREKDLDKIPMYHFGPDGSLKNCPKREQPEIKDYEITYQHQGREYKEKVIGLSENDAKARLLEHVPTASKMRAEFINPQNNNVMAKKTKNEEPQVQKTEQQVTEQAAEAKKEKKPLDGIQVYKTKESNVWVVQEWKNGEKVTPARRIDKEDREAYFENTKNATKEVVQAERQKLYEKYLSPEAEKRRAEKAAEKEAGKVEKGDKKEVKPLPKAAEEVAARFSKVSMYDGKEGNKMLRVSIDGQDPIYKPVKADLLASFFEGAKDPNRTISKEEWEERRVSLAAQVFAKELNTPKEEQSESQGMQR